MEAVALISFIVSMFPFWLNVKRKLLRHFHVPLISNDRASTITDADRSASSASIKSLMLRKSCVDTNVDNQRDDGRVDVLLHNISHIDMVLSVCERKSQDVDDDIIARPKFGCFHDVSANIYEKIEGITSENMDIIAHPVYSRQMESRRSLDRSNKTKIQLPVGFNLTNYNVTIDNAEKVKYRIFQLCYFSIN
jgi:hypothetical protein